MEMRKTTRFLVLSLVLLLFSASIFAAKITKVTVKTSSPPTFNADDEIDITAEFDTTTGVGAVLSSVNYCTGAKCVGAVCSNGECYKGNYSCSYPLQQLTAVNLGYKSGNKFSIGGYYVDLNNLPSSSGGSWLVKTTFNNNPSTAYFTCFTTTQSSTPVCSPTGEEKWENGNCADGKDNDCDGRIDTDPECTLPKIPEPEPTPSCLYEAPEQYSMGNCNDGKDNDCNGDIDSADSKCTKPTPTCTPTGDESWQKGNCNDGKDNDCDGNLDTDFECKPPACVYDDIESLAKNNCNDGKDNDCDGQTDTDSACTASQPSTPQPTSPAPQTPTSPSSGSTGIQKLAVRGSNFELTGESDIDIVAVPVNSTGVSNVNYNLYYCGNAACTNPVCSPQECYGGTVNCPSSKKWITGGVLGHKVGDEYGIGGYYIDLGNYKYIQGATWMVEAFITGGAKTTSCFTTPAYQLAENACVADGAEDYAAGNCADGKDNDCDGNVDTDIECAKPLAEPSEECVLGEIEHHYAGNCWDGIDNDCDGMADTDPECELAPRNYEDGCVYDKWEDNNNGNCVDGKDNDCDGWTDSNDTKCGLNRISINTYTYPVVYSVDSNSSYLDNRTEESIKQFRAYGDEMSSLIEMYRNDVNRSEGIKKAEELLKNTTYVFNKKDGVYFPENYDKKYDGYYDIALFFNTSGFLHSSPVTPPVTIPITSISLIHPTIRVYLRSAPGAAQGSSRYMILPGLYFFLEDMGFDNTAKNEPQKAGTLKGAGEPQWVELSASLLDWEILRLWNAQVDYIEYHLDVFGYGVLTNKTAGFLSANAAIPVNTTIQVNTDTSNSSGCYSSTVVEETYLLGNCADGVDNDCDGMADTDPECAKPTVAINITPSENALPLPDLNVGCSPGTTSVKETYQRGNCADGKDNDCDGQIDTDQECTPPKSKVSVEPSAKPRYLILSQKNGLEGKYGKDEAKRVMKAIEDLAAAKRDAGFEVLVEYMDTIDTDGLYSGKDGEVEGTTIPVLNDRLLEVPDSYKIHKLGVTFYSPMIGGLGISGSRYYEYMGKDPARLLLNTRTIVKRFKPDFVLIVGSFWVFPYQRYVQKWTSFEIIGRTIDIGINPFGDAYSTLTDDFYTDIDNDENNLPDVPIGRISDGGIMLAGKNNASILIRLLDNVIKRTGDGKSIIPQADYYGDASFATNRRLFYEDDAVRELINLSQVINKESSPPFKIAEFKGNDTIYNKENLDKIKSTFSNRRIMILFAHGAEYGVQMFEGRSNGGVSSLIFWPRALLQLVGMSGFILDLSCWGGYIEVRSSSESLSVTSLYRGASQGYVGNTQWADMAVSSKYGISFLEQVQRVGTMGMAFIEAKKDVFKNKFDIWLRERAPIPGIAPSFYHTIHGFIYFGDPSVKIDVIEQLREG